MIFLKGMIILLEFGVLCVRRIGILMVIGLFVPVREIIMRRLKMGRYTARARRRRGTRVNFRAGKQF